MSCTRCGRKFDKHVERRSLKPVIEKISDRHIHHGLPYYKYGICERSHYTRLERTQIEWSSCMKCYLAENRPAQSARKPKVSQTPKVTRSKGTRSKSARRIKKDINTNRHTNRSVPRSKKIPEFLMREIYGSPSTPLSPQSPIVSPPPSSPTNY